MKRESKWILVLFAFLFVSTRGCATVKGWFASDVKEVKRASAEVTGSGSSSSSSSGFDAPKTEEEKKAELAILKKTDPDKAWIMEYEAFEQKWPFTSKGEEEYHFKEFESQDFSVENRKRFDGQRKLYEERKGYYERLSKREARELSDIYNWDIFEGHMKAYDEKLKELRQIFVAFGSPAQGAAKIATHKETGKPVLVTHSGKILQYPESRLKATWFYLRNLSAFFPKDDPDVKQAFAYQKEIRQASDNSKALLNVYEPKNASFKNKKHTEKVLQACFKRELPDYKLVHYGADGDWVETREPETLVTVKYTKSLYGILLAKKGGKYFRYDFILSNTSYSDGKDGGKFCTIRFPVEIPKSSLKKRYQK